MLVRAAVEAALTVAREGLTLVPPLVPPPGIRRYLGFTKLSTAAVRAVAQVLERDDDYRSRVAAAVDEAAVGRAAWLWLTRPEGWEEEFAQLRREAAATAASASDAREERDARRRLTAARAAAERAVAKALEHEQEAAGIRADLAEEQSQRRRLDARVAGLEAELAQARDERASAVRQLKQVEATLARRAAEAKAATARLRALEQDRQVPPPPGSEPASGPGSLDPVALTEALGTASGRAAELADALHELTELVASALEASAGRAVSPAAPAPRPSAPSPRPPSPGAAPPAAPSARPPSPGAASSAAPTLPRAGSEEPAKAATSLLRRSPLNLPPGLRDDSPEAVDILLRAPGAWLLVDGYNISMTGWPEASVAEQRRRLVVGLGELAARTGAAAKVVFDGAADEPSPLPRSSPHLVSVMFSPAGVEADDVLLQLVGQLPVARPVVVASSDNRVREGARRLGANLVHARQLLAAFRR